MKIVIVGSDKIYAIENFFVKYLKNMGVEITHFPAQTFFYDYYQAGLFNKLIFRAGVSNILHEINKHLKKKIEETRPDIVWIFKGMEVFPETVKWIRDQGIKLVNYNPDNPFLFTGSGSGNKNITRAIKYFDLHFTYSKEIEAELGEKLGMKTAYLPFGYDISEELVTHCHAQQEVVKCCFLGNPDSQRAEFIQALAESGVEIDLYGNDWKRFVSHKRLTILDPVYDRQFWETLYRYRVQLNIMRIHNLQSHNMRSFEIPGIGGIQLAPDTPEHRLFFTEGNEIFLYKDIEDCRKKAEALLVMPTKDAQQIRIKALQRSVNSGYCYRSRAASALKEMSNLLHA
jgi:spore maturation protein CgeB